MIRLKTAVLIGFSLELGGLVANCDKKTTKILYKIGEMMGIGFQLMDDYLDVFGSSDFGKKIGGDIVSNKKTYLMIKLLEKSDKDDLENLCKIKLPESLKGAAKAKVTKEDGTQEENHTPAQNEQDNGKAKECLKEKLDKKLLKLECKEAVEEQVKFELQDIRINYKAFKACKPGIEKFCKEYF